MKKLLKRHQIFSLITTLGLATFLSLVPAQSFAAGPGDAVGYVDIEKVLSAPHYKDKIEGNAEAPVTIIEYASLSCSHCGDFYLKTLPEIRKKYIETGKAKLIFREVAGDVWAQAGFMLAHCQPEERYAPMLKLLFEQQKTWLGNGAELKKIGKLAGLDEDAFKACLSNQEILDGLKASTEGGQTLDVKYTPTFFINGDKYEGVISIDEMSKAIDKFLK